MSTQTFDIQAAIALAAEKGKAADDVSSSGGFERVVPPEGIVMLRFITYIEYGKHTTESKQYGKKTNNKARLEFELHGKNYPYIELEDGRKLPQIIGFDLNISHTSKSVYPKLFAQMNWEGDAKVFPQLLGKEFIGTVVHSYGGEEIEVDDGKGGKIKRGKNTYANLKDSNGYTIRSPFLSIPVTDPDTGAPTGEFTNKRIAVPQALSDLKLFLWDFASKPMWDALYIEGKYDDRTEKDGTVIPGKSKNRWQNLIRSAENFDELSHVIDGLDGVELGDDTPLTPERKEEDVVASETAKAVNTSETKAAAATTDALALGADELAF